MYEKPLKRKKDGSFERWLGVDYKGTKQVFRMPAEISQEEADLRWHQISALWRQIESEVVPPDFPRQSLDAPWSASWEEERLKTAKEIAKGEKPKLERFFCESSLAYVRRLVRTQTQLDSHIEPGDEQSYQTGIENLRRLISVSNEQLSQLLDKPGTRLTGVSVREALNAYREDIDSRKKYRTPDGRRKPWAKTQLDNIASLMTFYLTDFLDLDLGELSANKCDEIIDILAARPLTQRGTPLKLSSAKHLVKQVRNFYRWLNKRDDFPWDVPSKFDLRATIEYRKDGSEERHASRTQRENVTIPVEHLKVIAEYGTPLERMYFFLALNCAYGADQLGRLRTQWIDLEAAKIDGERLKVESISRHHLWRINVEALRWYLSQHKRDSLLFIASSGNPVYHETESGNVIDGFANRWNNLIGRINRDHPDFPKYSFGKIRKTAATEILRLADPHIASMLLAHKTISEDELLRRYANLPWENLYDAQKHLEEQLAPVFEAASATPFGRKPKTYIGVGRTKAIFELDDAGKTPAEIAAELGITSATVYRHLQSRYGKRKPGRKRNTARAQTQDEVASDTI